MKVLINARIGGFGLSDELLGSLKLTEPDYLSWNKILGVEDTHWVAWRASYKLIMAVEMLGLEASADEYCRLKIVEIPNDVDWRIGSNEMGQEWVYEVHRIWT